MCIFKNKFCQWTIKTYREALSIGVSRENNAQGIEKEDKEAIADKQRPSVRLAAQKAIHRIREQSEMNT